MNFTPAKDASTSQPSVSEPLLQPNIAQEFDAATALIQLQTPPKPIVARQVGLSQDRFDIIWNNLSNIAMAKNVLQKEVVDKPVVYEVADKSDIYSPRFVKNTGAFREGLCILCEYPMWYRIKTSSYWQHMHWFHGVSAQTKQPMPKFSAVSHDPNLRVQCPKCSKWINLTTLEDLQPYYKHAQKCFK